MAGLSDAEVTQRLANLPGWKQDGNAITKTFEAETFASGIEFVRKVAMTADEMDHHPDIDIRYTNITFRLTSHDTGGVTDRDLRLATEINDLA
ncbi:MAG: 4a-hydroxytetrahydrobiopterin dehydratase [Dehalococcoidia bacterium]